MKELDELRNVFVSGVDDELRADNEEKIREWESALLENEALQSWQEHDITKKIIKKARDSYVQTCFQLLDHRTTDFARQLLFAEQDAMLWFIRLASSDPKAEINRINQEIRNALNATN